MRKPVATDDRAAARRLRRLGRFLLRLRDIIRAELTVIVPISGHRAEVYSRWMAKPEEVLARLAAGLQEAMGNQLLSVAVHGSWALGDFTPGHSDLDVLAVMATDPTPATLAAQHEVHARLGTDFPEWGDGHVEVEYVSAKAIRAVVHGTAESHPMISVGKGEPLHELETTRHSVLNWAAALQVDRPIAGAAPSTVLPAIDRRLIHEVVLQHVRACLSGWTRCSMPVVRPTPS